MLATYRFETRSLLRDRLGLLTPTDELDRWINSARREAAELTGCLERLIPGQSPFGAQSQPGLAVPGGPMPGQSAVNSFQTIVGQERYPFDFGSQFLRKLNTGLDQIIDVISVSVMWGNNSSMRPSLNWMAWEDFQAYCRAYAVLVTSYPLAWSTDGDGENANVWLFPVPSQATEMEWQVTATPAPLNTTSDPELLPRTFQRAIKFGAAKLALLGSNRYAQAANMETLFLRSLGISRNASDRGKTTRWYG